jgi:nucleoid DNA-binding protein
VNKLNLAHEIAIGADIPLSKGELVLQVILKNIETALVTGESIQIAGFGAFSVKPRSARKGRNPKTGEIIQIESSNAIKFSPGKGFKDFLNIDQQY